jgi:acetyl-CoA synthetase
MKAGSAGPGVPGIYPVIFDDEGNVLPRGAGKAGNICIRNPWPGRMLTIWGDDERFVRQYYARYNKDPKSKDWRDWPYFAGDGAVYAADGYFRILGRIDDVINVSGHRLGTKELESAALTVVEVGEAAVVPVPDPIKGRVPHMFVSLKPGYTASKELEQKITDTLAREIGPFAKPGRVWIVPDMPKTRSGKIMRRVLAAIADNKDPGDVMTLANPEVVEAIRKMA